MTEQGWIFVVGIGVAVISYFAKNFILEPLIQYRKVVGRIRNRLKFYANVFGNNVKQELQNETSRSIRQLSCDLEESYYSIGWLKLLVCLRLLPSQNSIEKSASNLIGLSNSTGPKMDYERLIIQADIIRQELRMPDYITKKDKAQ